MTKIKNFIEAKELFSRQLENGWNGHLDTDHRLYEAFIHGYTLGLHHGKESNSKESDNEKP